jgi:cytochrome c556
MKMLICVLFVLGLVTLSGLASQFARSDDEKTPTIKEVMQKLHKGPNAALAKLKKDLASDSLDWKDIQAKTKEFETYGAALPKNDPPKGEKENWKKLADSYFETAKKLNAAAKKEEKDGVQTAFAKISNACAACHKAHRPN